MKQNDFTWPVCRATKIAFAGNMRIASCCVGFSACKPTDQAALSMAASTSTVPLIHYPMHYIMGLAVHNCILTPLTFQLLSA